MPKLCSCLFATALVAFATPALSADLTLGVVIVELPPAPDEPYDWTGPYAGIFAGVAWGRTAATDVGIAGASFLDPNETISAATIPSPPPSKDAGLLRAEAQMKGYTATNAPSAITSPWCGTARA